ncbi:MAG: hypothetical protein Q8M29_14120 [Bacteroidota bacterium]|nr:hypothetical protein [Bacteroidota bacterium]
MKLFFITTLFSLFCVHIPAQQKNCYNEWNAKFAERGADSIEDGEYSDVIITFRKPGNTTCYNGAAQVKNGKLEAFYTEEENGELKPVKREWEGSLKNITVNNGRSATMVARGNELVVIFWPRKLKQSTHIHDKDCSH